MTDASGQPYRYSASLVRVIDADTVSLSVCLGFYVTVVETFRLAGINAPERFTEAGKAATQFATDWFARQTSLVLESEKPPHQEKYGRWLATIRGSDGTILNDSLVAAGHAVLYLTDRT
jgi:endonuclease YncB( thermonuclease family)